MARMEQAGAGKAKRKRRSFTDEFRAGAVGLVLDSGMTIAEVARDLDLTPSSLGGWVERARADRSKGRTGLTTEERAELARLRKENAQLVKERDLLKNGRPSSPKRMREVRVHLRGEGRRSRGRVDVPGARRLA